MNFDIQRAINVYIDGGKAVLQDLKSVDPRVLMHNILNFDLASFDSENLPLIMLMTAFAGFIAFVAYAQLTGPSSDGAPITSTINAAIGKSSDVVQRPGDPPIPPPTQITSLRVYPIKSCRGIELADTRLRKTGLTLDRNWMFVDKENHNFLTIRSDSKMTLIDTAITEHEKTQYLEISIQGSDKKVEVPAFPSEQWLKANTTLRTVEIWEQETDAWEYSEDVNSVFTDFFGKPVALVYKGPTHRNVAVNGSEDKYGKKQNHNFADVMSLLVASEASIKDLNHRLTEKGLKGDLTIERFRPNVIVRGRDDHPWEEDTWKRVRITTNIPEDEAIYKLDLDIVARCARCQVPNVDPDTAEKHPKEPWDEMMKFRRVDQGQVAKWKPCFGMLAIPKNEGRIRVGATLDVLETTDKHLYNVARFEDL